MPLTPRSVHFQALARTGPDAPVAVANSAFVSARLHVSMQAVSGSAQVTFFVEGIDPQTGEVYTLLELNPITAVGSYDGFVDPRIPPIPGQVAQAPIPSRVRLRASHATSDACTYAASLELAY